MPTAPLLSTNLVLIGYMGTGKSSVGRLLAGRLGFRFVDTDTMIVREAGMPITEIFATEGEAAFRDRESAALKKLRGRRGIVVATGGGIIERKENRPLLREIGCVVSLTATQEVIFARVSRNKRRPLLQNADPRGTIAKMLERRAPLYQACAQFEIDTTTRDHAGVADAILSEAINRYPQA